MAKYRAVFLEEATEHLEDLSRALLELEREPARAEAIDLAFRMAHSIKGMAASLDYEPIAEVAHRLEDRMQGGRGTGRVEPDELALLFKGLEGLEALLAAVRETGQAPPAADPWLLHALAAPLGPPRKKAPRPR
jgi:two-component system chemotaxis sensor kinase CheA